MTELEQALAYARDVGLTDRHIAAAVKMAADQVRFTPVGDGLVTLTHPNLPGQRIRVLPDSVSSYTGESGWQLEQPEEPTEPEEAPVKASRTKKTEE